MKKLVYILLALLVFNSCSDFQKVMKSEDIGLKFKTGEELFDAGKYSKANRLFEQIVPKYRGKPQAEKLMYMHSMCFYKQEQYYLSGYRFEQFVSSYPKSEKAEEAAFLSAKSYYEESPIYSKDIEQTVKAIEKVQLFINSYPDSEYLPEANELVKELDFKLEKKAFEIAKQYNHIFDYKASIKSFNNFLLDFPGATLREDALYYKFNSEYNLAILSIASLQPERIQIALADYNALIKAYPNTKYLDEANSLKEELEKVKQESKS
ncbi:MAG: outer membrane protein assembly factor BamD [Winogradskyella sp.]|uniref:outer membrane protein assembly factor BamD n=1 Tax=Winogradskyella sp. TaxID=1883156 RepID=UPI001856F415|nr:outer membrane protein assembly factor BamD [Winogradskyella sp.]MBT8245839.1 outer membrane protein assembly factor BamD [Winogradskyella sp.]NNK22610.1 outer membrane protein assembly factor BamD [Winogradskyella sp.]